jgi:outer membrane lipoprotein-sorting protein
MNKTFWSALLIFLSVVPGNSQPDAKEIMDQVRERFSQVKDYTAEALVSLEMERLRIPRRQFKVYFKQPDKYHFESDGFVMIPREGFGFMPTQFQPGKYTAQILGQDTIDNFHTYKLQLSFIGNKNKKKQFIIWVDSKDWLIRKIVSNPFEKRQTSVSITYGRIQNTYMMPSSMRIELKNEESGEDSLAERKDSEHMLQRLPRTGTITITFVKYSVNQNIPDKLFESENPKK